MAFKVDSQMDVESTMGEKIYSTEISAAGMENLMPLFIGLYGDSYLAVLREYVSNALDSHIAAGVDAPVLVTLPSAFNPQLVVADQGLGLSLDDIGSRLVQYGESDKDVDGWMSGGYGVGAKCAWAVSPHFIVEAVKDGRRVIVQLALNESGRGEVFLLESEDTSDPNGVTVTVPIDDHERMARVAEKFFSTWKPGSALVNGKQPVYVLGDVTEDAPGIRVARKPIDGFDRGVLFLLNHVAYPVGREMMAAVADRLEASGDRALADLARGMMYRQVFVECRKSDFVPVPTREAVRDDEISLRTLEDVFRRIGAAAQEGCAEVAAASNVADACRAAVALDDWLAPFGELREQTQPLWRGRRIYSSLGHASFRLLVRREGSPTNFVVRRTSADPLGVRDVALLTAVTGCTDARSVAKVNGYARAFFAERADREILVAVDSGGMSDDCWFECGPDSGVETITLSDFVKRYAPAKQEARHSVAGSDVSYRVARRTDGAWTASTMSVAQLREHDGPVVVGSPAECPRSLPLGDVVVVDLERKSGSALTKRVPGVETVAAFTERLLAGIEWSQHENIIATSKSASLRANLSRWSKALGEERWAQVRHEGVLRVISLPAHYGLTTEQKDIAADWRMVPPDANPSVAVVQQKTAWIDDVEMDVSLLSALSVWRIHDNDAAKNDVVAYINMKAGVK